MIKRGDSMWSLWQDRIWNFKKNTLHSICSYIMKPAITNKGQQSQVAKDAFDQSFRKTKTEHAGDSSKTKFTNTDPQDMAKWGYTTEQGDKWKTSGNKNAQEREQRRGNESKS